MRSHRGGSRSEDFSSCGGQGDRRRLVTDGGWDCPFQNEAGSRVMRMMERGEGGGGRKNRRAKRIPRVGSSDRSDTTDHHQQ